MTKRITKAQILREARRVYADALALREEHFSWCEHAALRYQANVLLIGGRYAVSTCGRSRAEARRMALAALQAAGSAK